MRCKFLLNSLRNVRAKFEIRRCTDGITEVSRCMAGAKGRKTTRVSRAPPCDMAQSYMKYDIVGARSPDDLVGSIVVSNRGALVAQMGADDN